MGILLLSARQPGVTKETLDRGAAQLNYWSLDHQLRRIACAQQFCLSLFFCGSFFSLVRSTREKKEPQKKGTVRDTYMAYGSPARGTNEIDIFTTFTSGIFLATGLKKLFTASYKQLFLQRSKTVVMYLNMVFMTQKYLLTIDSSHLKVEPINKFATFLQLTNRTKVVHLHFRVFTNHTGLVKVRARQLTIPNFFQHLQRVVVANIKLTYTLECGLLDPYFCFWTFEKFPKFLENPRPGSVRTQRFALRRYLYLRASVKAQLIWIYHTTWQRLL